MSLSSSTPHSPLPSETKRPGDSEADSTRDAKKLKLAEPNGPVMAAQDAGMEVARGPSDFSFMKDLSGEMRNLIYGELLRARNDLEISWDDEDGGGLLADELDLPEGPPPGYEEPARDVFPPRALQDLDDWHNWEQRNDPPGDDDLEDWSEVLSNVQDWTGVSDPSECTQNLRLLMQVRNHDLCHEARSFFYASNTFWLHESDGVHSTLNWNRFLDTIGPDARMVLKKLILHGRKPAVPLEEHGKTLTWAERQQYFGERFTRTMQLLQECKKLEAVTMWLSFTDMFVGEQDSLKNFLLHGQPLSTPSMCKLLRLKDLPSLKQVTITLEAEMTARNIFDVLPPKYQGRDLRFMKFALSGLRAIKIVKEVRSFLRARFPPSCKVLIRWSAFSSAYDSRKARHEMEYDTWKIQPDLKPGSPDDGTTEDLEDEGDPEAEVGTSPE